MTVDQRTPRLHEINEGVPVCIGDGRPLGVFDVNRVAMDRFEGPHRRIYAAYKVLAGLGVKGRGDVPDHVRTPNHPSFAISRAW